MSYKRSQLGDSAIPGFTPAVGPADGTSIDWNQIIENGLQIAGQAINGQPVPTYYPTYTPTNSAFSNNALPLLALGAVALYLLAQRRR